MTPSAILLVTRRTPPALLLVYRTRQPSNLGKLRSLGMGALIRRKLPSNLRRPAWMTALRPVTASTAGHGSPSSIPSPPLPLPRGGGASSHRKRRGLGGL